MLRCCDTLNNTFIHVFYFSPLPSLECYKTPRELVQRDIRCQVVGPCPRKETGHLLFPRSDMKRHFYFCGPRLGSPLRRVGASTAVLSFLKILSRGYQCHIRERGLASGFEGAELTIWISLPYTFKEFRSPLPRFSSHSPPPPRPSNFPYFSSNRLARDSASCITGCSSPGLAASPLLCSRSRYSPRAILICLSFPCFRVCSRSGASRALKRGE